MNTELSETARQARNEYAREWRAKNKDHVRAYMRKWQQKNPDKVRANLNRYWERKAKQTTAQDNTQAATD